MRRADNLATFVCRLSWNLGASAFRNPQGPSMPLMGFIYLTYPTGCLLHFPSPSFSVNTYITSQKHLSDHNKVLFWRDFRNGFEPFCFGSNEANFSGSVQGQVPVDHRTCYTKMNSNWMFVCSIHYY
jgi:hypothetical protein